MDEENKEKAEKTDIHNSKENKGGNRYKLISAILAILLFVSVILGVLLGCGVIGKDRKENKSAQNYEGQETDTDGKNTTADSEMTDIITAQNTVTDSTTAAGETLKNGDTDALQTSEATMESNQDENDVRKTTEEHIPDNNVIEPINNSDNSNGQNIADDEDDSNANQGSETDQNSGNSGSDASYTADFKMSNSWESNGKICCQYEISISNNSSVTVNSWNIAVNIPSITAVMQNWGCNCELSGTLLEITPVDYTKEIAAGSKAGNIGIIIECTSNPGDFTYSGTTGDTATEGDESGQDDVNQPDVTPYVPPALEPGTPVGNHGQLYVSGTDLLDQYGQKYQLKGVSTHGIAWYPDYVNADAFKTLRDNWGANMVRIAMYTDEYGGYCSGGDRANLEALVSKGVEACTDLGMYVIIDWHILHDNNPNQNIESAKTFFDKMSAKYASNVNVIYEICNEPNGGTTWADVKSYADTIIPVIKNNSPNAVIIVGTPTWSQDVDQVAANPLNDSVNVMYAFHFYAATHKDDLRNKVKAAIDGGTPVFISEFSICDASGNGGIDYDSAKAWKDFINSYNLSYAGWSLSNKAETSALIKSDCTKLSNWETGDLSDTGVWLRNMISGN